MARLTLTNLRKSFGPAEILHGIDLEIDSGEFIVFVGPSGCGKSTLLRTIAGLENITAGTLAFDGEVMNDVPPARRGVAMVFQSYALYPHMTVFDNMAFGLKLGGGGRREIAEKVTATAQMLQIEPLLDRLPKQLSGGQRQRVAIGRAIVREPRVFLFDEPLSNLDAALRVQTRLEIAKLHSQMSETTMIYVTHDQVEAMTLADRIVVLREGHVEQVGTPMELYLRPSNLFVARFVGTPAMNIIDARIDGADAGAILHPGGGRAVPLGRNRAAIQAAGPVKLGVRPEHLYVDREGEPLFTGPVSHVEQLGEFQLVYLALRPGREMLTVKLPGEAKVSRGETIGVSAHPAALRLFDRNGNALAVSFGRS